LRILRRIIRSKGGELSAAYGIHMPQNAFHKPRENYQEIYAEWKKKLELIVRIAWHATTGVLIKPFKAG